jgi:ferric-dicitrate binding protein FerR (iron transport regulator)
VVFTGPDSAVALRTAIGQSVRASAECTLEILAERELALPSGTAYVDAGSLGSASGPLTMATPFGAVAHVGTQYEVRVTDDSLRVRVREGQVRVARAGAEFDVDRGTSWTVDSTGQVVRESTPLHGASWDWAAEVAPLPAIDGRPLEEFLGWVARETGLTVTWTDPALGERSRGIVLTGSIAGLTLEDALAAVLSTCGLTHHTEGASLIVESALEER